MATTFHPTTAHVAFKVHASGAVSVTVTENDDERVASFTHREDAQQFAQSFVNERQTAAVRFFGGTERGTCVVIDPDVVTRFDQQVWSAEQGFSTVAAAMKDARFVGERGVDA